MTVSMRDRLLVGGSSQGEENLAKAVVEVKFCGVLGLLAQSTFILTEM
jgi:hypothetical protein